MHLCNCYKKRDSIVPPIHRNITRLIFKDDLIHNDDISSIEYQRVRIDMLPVIM